MRITDFKHVSVFILRVNNIKKPQLILVLLKKTPGKALKQKQDKKNTRSREVSGIKMKTETIKEVSLSKTFINNSLSDFRNFI